MSESTEGLRKGQHLGTWAPEACSAGWSTAEMGMSAGTKRPIRRQLQKPRQAMEVGWKGVNRGNDAK